MGLYLLCNRLLHSEVFTGKIMMSLCGYIEFQLKHDEQQVDADVRITRKTTQ